MCLYCRAIIAYFGTAAGCGHVAAAAARGKVRDLHSGLVVSISPKKGGEKTLHVPTINTCQDSQRVSQLVIRKRFHCGDFDSTSSYVL